MLEIWITSGVVALIACILLIAMCTHEEEDVVPEAEPVEKDPENPQPVGPDGESFFKDPLEEISENVNFHVIPNSNKKTRAQGTPSPKKGKQKSEYSSESDSESQSYSQSESETSSESYSASESKSYSSGSYSSSSS